MDNSEKKVEKNIRIKRPAFILTLLLAAGAAAVRFEPFLIVLVSALLALIYISLKYKTGPFCFVALFLVLISYVIGCDVYRKPSELSSYCDIKTEITAQLVSYPEYSESVQGLFRVIEIDGKKTAEEKILVKLYSYEGTLVPGGVYEFEAVIHTAENASNPGGFDQKLYLSAQRIKAYANVYSDVEFVRKGELLFFYDDILNIRYTLDNIIQKNLDKEKAGLLSGVLFGESYMDEEVLESFRAVGAAHVLAVSGLHVGILHSFVVFVLKRLKFKKLSVFVISALVLLFYCAVTGFSPSVIRACVMFILMSFSSVTKNRGDSFNNLCIAASAMLVYNPMILFSVSFQMSFCAAASIVLFVPAAEAKLKKPRLAFWSKLRSLIIISVIVQLALSPVSIYYFNNLNAFSVIANLLIVPVISVVVIGGLIITLLSLILPFASQALFSLIGVTLDYLIKTAGFISDIDFAYFYIPSLRIREVLLLYVVIFALFGYFRLGKNKKRVKIFTAIMTAMLIWCSFLYMPPIKTQVYFLDVGQGDCCLIRTRSGENIIIDGGGYPGRNIAKFNIIPFMEYYKIRSLDAAIVTHSHSDHISGIIQLLEEGTNIEIIYANDDGTLLFSELSTAAEENGTEVEALRSGDFLKYDGATINVLLPRREMLGKAYINDSSMVILLSAEDVNFLLLGDIEDYGTETLLRYYDLGGADIIKASHHGEYCDYTQDLYESAKPEICVISVGKNNYSLPNDEFIEMLEDMRTEFYLTKDSGCIRVSVSGGKYRVFPYKQ